MYAHASRRAASYSVLPGLQLRLASASCNFSRDNLSFGRLSAPAIAATVPVAAVATKADISFPLSTTTSHRRTMIVMQHDYTKIASTVLTLKKSKFFIVS